MVPRPGGGTVQKVARSENQVLGGSCLSTSPPQLQRHRLWPALFIRGIRPYAPYQDLCDSTQRRGCRSKRSTRPCGRGHLGSVSGQRARALGAACTRGPLEGSNAWFAKDAMNLQHSCGNMLPRHTRSEGPRSLVTFCATDGPLGFWSHPCSPMEPGLEGTSLVGTAGSTPSCSVALSVASASGPPIGSSQHQPSAAALNDQHRMGKRE